MEPLKILHVANRTEKHDIKRYYTLPFKINNGFIRNGHNVYWYSDRDVAKTATIFRSGKMGRKACCEKLVRICKNFVPDIIALSHADLILPEYLAEIKGLFPRVKILQYNIDGLATEGTIEKVLSKIEVVDHTFMTTAGTALSCVGRENAPAGFIPNPVDNGIDCYRAWKKTEYMHDLFFVGARSDWLDPESLRARAFEGLPGDLEGVDVLMTYNLWGNEFMQTLSSCKMGVCFNQIPIGEKTGKGSKLYFYSSDRISQQMGNGVLTFVDARFNNADLYGHDALVEVGSYEEFLDKVRYYNVNHSERARIAQRGCELSHAEFNETLIARYMLETVLGLPYSHNYLWPTEQHKQ